MVLLQVLGLHRWPKESARAAANQTVLPKGRDIRCQSFQRFLPEKIDYMLPLHNFPGFPLERLLCFLRTPAGLMDTLLEKNCGLLKPYTYMSNAGTEAMDLGSSSSDKVGSYTEIDSVEASEAELQNFDSCEIEEGDYVYDEDEGCYVNGVEGPDYEFDEIDLYQQLDYKFDDSYLPPGVECSVPLVQKAVTDDGPDNFKSMSEIEDEIGKKYKLFKQFDIIKDFSDHHYASNPVGKTGKEWTKRIQHDWKLLENNLPASIYVRVSENRMDLLRAVIIGPQGTPYHDGLFFFDAQFTASYPATPPVVYYHSGGLRLNPNLYDCGTVCLSLLGTWHGNGCENWNSAHSSMLQVLISIQGLILNEKPYFNEPGYETEVNDANGQRRSLEYNDTAFQHSCGTMLYSLRRPPQHFEDLVAGHFRERGHAILAACKYYMEGNEVGSVVPDEDDEGKELENANARAGAGRRTASFKGDMKVLFEELLVEFSVKGADTKKFCAEKVKKTRQKKKKLKKSQPAAA
ncbi:putative ubiquitin-conjugating enzyme E2 38 [Aegilops tauschii subsp. strangulata]|uniref:putative ubiquitin-conjugating enzyme E2 38 n=1 Tax=Aegilops tauschii subsp. strangulata TaxID=200361 RepID=UPI00098B0459|nr:putative ubiquitin-conjugating enzyme E2 38 [Aegilops tauschii subsp. strangulata]